MKLLAALSLLIFSISAFSSDFCKVVQEQSHKEMYLLEEDATYTTSLEENNKDYEKIESVKEILGKVEEYCEQ